MEKKDIIDILFDKEEDEDLLSLKDIKQDRLCDKEELLGNQIMDFIDNKVHPDLRSTLKNLIYEKEKISNQYLHRENQLFYRNGVATAVQFIVAALSTK